MSRRAAVVMSVSTLVLAACHPTTHHETEVEITRMVVVRKNESGKPATLDLELSFAECPGSQIEVIRGGAEFAACVSKHTVGDRVKVAIEHKWDDEGVYKWVIKKVDDCDRVPDPSDEASFAMVRECEDLKVNGARVGLQCRYIPEKKLIDQCPWFRRR
jgi:hypothetical protein